MTTYFKKPVDLTQDMMGLLPGDYGKAEDGNWYCRPPADPNNPDWPKGLPPARMVQTIEEHPDGTITAYPSIVFMTGGGEAYHGWLKRGVWTKC